jgi:hypothetical protein
LTGFWGVVLIVDAGVNVVLAFTLPIDLVPVSTTAQWIALLVLMQVASQLYLRRPRVRAIVEAL